MFSVFSNTKKVSDQIRDLKNCAGSEFQRILLAGPDDEPLYILKPKAIYVLTWINRKILYELPKVKECINSHKDTQWVWVRVRVATAMLNKLAEEGILDKDINIEYHKRLIKNVRKILDEIYVEDLPF